MEKRDMQKLILKILVSSKKSSIPFLTHKQLVEEVKKLKPKEAYLERKVSQALWLLQQKKKKWDTPNVEKKEVRGSDGMVHTIGYTVDKLL